VLQVCDRVVALPEYRAWAELVAVPSRYVYPIPGDLSYLDAAAIAMNYLVAYILLFELGGLAPGKSVLVHSAGGGVVSTSCCSSAFKSQQSGI
jgi:NADPH:quinone reductase-like Zn-dependent oxidoreductase